MASTWCEQSLDIVSVFYSEKWVRTITSRQWMAGCQQSFASATAWSRHFLSLSPIEKATVRVKYYQLFIVKTTWGLIIKNIWHVSMNFTDTIWNFRLPRRDQMEVNGGILDIKIIFMEQKEHLLCNWESRECKHPKIIKGKRFILLLFWLSWPIYFAGSCLYCFVCWERCPYINAWYAFAEKLFWNLTRQVD